MGRFAAPDPVAAPLLEYDGKIGALYRIFMGNVLLTVLTLGIFWFWAATRMRRYVWSHTRFREQRFEYIGTGSELLLRFLMAIAIVIVLCVLAGFASVGLGRLDPRLVPVPVAVLAAVFAILALGLDFGRQRYRLSRTRWRGRCGCMRGSMIGYGVLALIYALLSAATLWQLAPALRMRLAARRVNASEFGGILFHCRTAAFGLCKRFAGSVLLLLAVVVIVGSAVWAAFGPVLGSWPFPPGVQTEIAVATSLAGCVAVLVAAALIWSRHEADTSRHLARSTTLGGSLRLGSHVTGPRLLGLWLGDAAIMIATVGLGYPVVLHRRCQFRARMLVARGTLDTNFGSASPFAQKPPGERIREMLDQRVA